MRTIVGRHQRGRLLSGLIVVGVLAGLFAWVEVAPAADEDEPETREFVLTAEETDWEIMPGTTVRAWAYNGQVPGPEIRVREGDRVRITLRNRLPVPTTVHWHGMNVPPEMDGPAGLNQAPVEPGQDFMYEFIADPAGSRMYHAHTDVATQIALGLYGPLVVEPREQGEKYDREYTYMLSEWDLEMTPDVATGAAPRGPRDRELRGGELGTDLFLMNGHAHEAINPIVVAEGERVLVRLMNMGSLPHPIHTHGHSFKVVATDGNLVPPAAQLTKDTILVGPGERYDIEIMADNPGVWMTHCHIESHAANGMMTVIQYESAEPSGPLKEFWDLPMGKEMGHGDGGHGSHGSTEVTPAATPEAPAEPAPPADGGRVPGANEIQMLDDRFEARNLTVEAGTTVTWVNKGADWHSVASFDGLFESVKIAPGDSFSYTFDQPGTYQYICRHHARQGMYGAVTVT